MTRVHAHSRHVVSSPHAKLVHGFVAQTKGAHSKVLALAVGMLLVPDTQGGRRVTQAQFDAAAAAIMALPAEDVARVARAGVTMHLAPAATLGQGMLGATKIIQAADGRWQPQVINVAAQANLSGTESLPEIVQHEFGHAISVLKSQDRSEEAAAAYAAAH